MFLYKTNYFVLLLSLFSPIPPPIKKINSKIIFTSSSFLPKTILFLKINFPYIPLLKESFKQNKNLKKEIKVNNYFSYLSNKDFCFIGLFNIHQKLYH